MLLEEIVKWKWKYAVDCPFVHSKNDDNFYIINFYVWYFVPNELFSIRKKSFRWHERKPSFLNHLGRRTGEGQTVGNKHEIHETKGGRCNGAQRSDTVTLAGYGFQSG